MARLAAGSIRSRLTHKRHAVIRDNICRVQGSFSVAELFLLSPRCWPVLTLSGSV